MSDSMKIIMESWRSWGITQKIAGDRFKHEPREPKKIEDNELPLALLVDVGLFSMDEAGNPKHELILYKQTAKHETQNQVFYANPRVIGMITVSLTTEPCITPTYQVNFSAVDSEFQKQGYGSLIYGLAFHYVNNNLGAGLTSDHEHSTSPEAEKIWDKLADTKGMVKKKTASGNDEFDYEYDNDDEDDDCDFGMAQRTLLSPLLGDKYRQGLATNHSWIMKGKRFKSVFDKLRKQHKVYSKLSSDEEVLIKELVTKASKLFDKEYGN